MEAYHGNNLKKESKFEEQEASEENATGRGIKRVQHDGALTRLADMW